MIDGKEPGTPAGQPRPKRGALWAIVALLIVAAIVVAGIIPRWRAKAALRSETYDLAIPTVAVDSSETRRAADGNHSSRKHSGVHGFAHLRPHERLPEKVVCGYRSARDSGPVARGYRNARGGSAARSGARGSEYRPGQLPAFGNHRDSLPGSAEDRFGLEAGRGQRQRRFRSQESDGGLGAVQREAPRGAAIVRENLRAVRRRDHRAQYRRRASDQFRRRRPGHRAIPYRFAAKSARLYQRAAAVFAGRQARHPRRSDAAGISRAALPGKAGSHRGRD